MNLIEDMRFLKSRIQPGKLKNANDILEIEFELTAECNYTCSYCFQNDRRGDGLFLDLNVFREKLKMFHRYVNEHKIPRVHIILMGGEMSRYEEKFIEYLDIINELFGEQKDTNLRIVYITNFSSQPKHYNKIIQYMKNFDVILVISLHRPYVNTTHALKNIKKRVDKVDCKFFIFNIVYTVKDDFYHKTIEFLENNISAEHMIIPMLVDQRYAIQPDRVKSCSIQQYSTYTNGVTKGMCRNIIEKYEDLNPNIIICRNTCPCPNDGIKRYLK